MKRIAWQFGLLAAALLILLQLGKYSLYAYPGRQEVWLTALAAAFVAFGVWLNRWMRPPREHRSSPSSTEAAPEAAHKATSAGLSPTPTRSPDELGISKREFDVLEQVAMGKSNKEIAEALFISENTVKTHVSNLLVKLDAKRRTQAVSRAQALNLIP